MKKQIVSTLLALAIVRLQPADAQQSRTRTFGSATEACETLFRAVQAQDQQALEAVLGKDIASSGDESEEKLSRQRFVEKYERMHRLVREPDGTTELYVGAENWPFPIPLVSENGRWRFDSGTGNQEILFRRIGENETTAIRIAALATGRSVEDPTEPVDDAARQVAIRLRSAGIGASPKQEAFHGYNFLAKSGEPAESGKRKKTDHVVLIAFPTEYRSSGVVTFIVAGDGRVYERDLGTKTAQLAPAITKRPASGWYQAH